MKLKLFIAFALVVALTAGLWLRFHRPQPAATFAQPAARQEAAPLPKPFPSNPVKMKVVASQPAIAAVSPAASDWSAVGVIVNDQADYRERLDAIASLSSHLTDADWTLLQKFLLKPDAQDNGQQGQVVKNELLDKLCSMNPPPSGLGDVLTQMYRDHAQNDVLRDYAVQHMAACYEQRDPQTTDAITIQKTLWEATIETSDSIGGTALLALKRLSQEYNGFDQTRIASTALQMARDNSAGELTHITAYQVCAQLGTADALPTVLDAAQNGETIPVRMSAIGALGLLGGQDQIPFLNGVLAGNEERLKPVAQHALEQIAVRQNQLASQK